MTNRDVPARPGDAVAVRTRTGAPWTSGDLEDAEPALTVSSLDTGRRWRRPLPFTLANGTVSAVTRRRLRRIPRHLATDTGRYAADSRPSGRTYFYGSPNIMPKEDKLVALMQLAKRYSQHVGWRHVAAWHN